MLKQKESCAELVSKAIYYNTCTPDLVELQKWDLHPLFTYGTLKVGHFLHYYLEDQKFVAKGATSSNFTLFNYRNAYPVLTINGALPSKTREIDKKKIEGRVTGELYLVDTTTMRRLDMVEANGEMYRRLKLPIEFITDPIDHGSLKDKVGMNAWVYVGIPDHWSRSSNLTPYEIQYSKGIPTLTFEDHY